MERLKAELCIAGSGPAAHTAAIYGSRAGLETILFEGWLANGVAAGGHLTVASEVEQYPGFPQGILGPDLAERFREQSLRFGTRIFTETVRRVNFSVRPFLIYSDTKEVEADTVVIATGAVAKRLHFPRAGEEGFWNRGISACARCDGAAPIFRDKPLAVVGGGDSAMEEANFLSRFGSKIYIVHRRSELRACKAMQRKALANPKVQVLWNSEVVEAFGNERGVLGIINIRNTVTGEITDLNVSGLFFAIGREPATRFLDGQVQTDSDGYILTSPGTGRTSVPGVFAAGDVQDKKWRQAVTAARTGCIAALEAQRYLQDREDGMVVITQMMENLSIG